jgi:hypothetical protein
MKKRALALGPGDPSQVHLTIYIFFKFSRYYEPISRNQLIDLKNSKNSLKT